jgi:GTP-binding protein Era
MQKQNTSEFRAGYIAVMGRPNVGKSTLVNALLGQKVAAVSPRPQTTRKRQLGILTIDHAQLIFIDTPGLHLPRHKLGENMNEQAAGALQESDLILFVVDGSQPPQEEDQLLADRIRTLAKVPPVLLVINKSDLIEPDQATQRKEEFQTLDPLATVLVISATQGDQLDILLEEMIEHLPVNPPFYPEDQITDLYERDISADLIREASLILLRDEIPHGVAIRIDQFTEREETGLYIEATLFVERESHKAIVIGQAGSMIKRIGEKARHEIETLTGRKVYLRLRVKVRKNWRDDEKVLRWFGF